MALKSGERSAGLGEADYRALADFRFLLRRFMTFSEDAAETEGLAPQQHQALLAIKACGRKGMSVGALAERLVIRPNSAVGLVDRLDKLDLVRRTADPRDRRRVALTLTARAERVLARLTVAHRQELSRIAPTMRAILKEFQARG
jgi:DNA-binding MarR family transcriptional regulator